MIYVHIYAYVVACVYVGCLTATEIPLKDILEVILRRKFYENIKVTIIFLNYKLTLNAYSKNHFTFSSLYYYFLDSFVHIKDEKS